MVLEARRRIIMKKLGKRAVALIAVIVLGMTSLMGCANGDSNEVILDENEIVATVNDIEITVGVANFYARYQQSLMEGIYGTYYGDKVWSMELADGYTYEDSMKDIIMEYLQELYIVSSHTDEFNVTLTDDDLAAIEAAAKSFDEENSAEVKEKVSGSKENVIEYLKLITINEKMAEAMIADVDKNVSDDEAAQKRLRYVLFSKSTTAENGSTKKLSDAEVAKLKTEAEAFLTAAKANGNLETYAKEAEKESKTLTFDAESTDISKEAIKAADALQEKEFTELIETDTGFYVIQLESLFDKEATEEAKEEIIADREAEQYDKLFEEWKEKAELTVNEEVWAKISFVDFKVNSTVEEEEEKEEE